MKRFRLKADGRIVELRDGDFHSLPQWKASRTRPRSPPCATCGAVRSRQIEFAARLGVPVETIRNWELAGKRAPRGPARALLARDAHSPETVFASTLRRKSRRSSKPSACAT